MMDKRKVLKGLEIMRQCSGPSYPSVTTLIDDAICLLMVQDRRIQELTGEQEALNVIYSRSEFGNRLPHCPSCKTTLPNRSVYGKSSFCYACGQPVKWLARHMEEGV